MAAWAEREPSVTALVLIGSQTRSTKDSIWHPDAQSDWDFQIVTSNPQMFFDSNWTKGLKGAEIRAYAVREARLGDVPKINAVFADVEADFVLLPLERLEQLRQATDLGQHRLAGEVRRNLQSLAIVIRPGWHFLKGAKIWEPFYQSIISEVPDARMDDVAVRSIAEGFVCDYVWALRKLERGELLAVQRMLHRELVEVNFKLMHELKLRRDERSFPEARRIELVTNQKELMSLSVSSSPDAHALKTALKHAADTQRSLVNLLLGASWHWPRI